MSLQTPLARARGLGSAKQGGHHWRAQRLSAIALTPLTLWFVASLLTTVGAEYDTAVQWLGSPLNATLVLIFIWAIFYHAYLGIQIILEDYVHTEWLRIALSITTQFAAVLMGIISSIAVLRVALGS